MQELSQLDHFFSHGNQDAFLDEDHGRLEFLRSKHFLSDFRQFERDTREERGSRVSVDSLILVRC